MLVAPVLPWLTDSDEQLDATLALIAEAGASSATVLALHLRPGAREWFWSYLRRHHPQLEEVAEDDQPVDPGQRLDQRCAQLGPREQVDLRGRPEVQIGDDERAHRSRRLRCRS